MKDCAQPLQHIEHGIPPVFDERSEVLVLGTMPSPKSREAAFFYGHPQNRFWRVLAALFDEPVPEDNAERADLLLRHHIALWDVLESCDIRGASDASIANPHPNDLSRVLEKAPVRRVFCTGAAAGRYYAKLCEAASGLAAEVLPSPSPANAAWSLPRLVEAYRPVADATTPFKPPVLEVSQVVALERAIAEAGTPLDALMRRAGRFLAFEACKALEGMEGDSHPLRQRQQRRRRLGGRGVPGPLGHSRLSRDSGGARGAYGRAGSRGRPAGDGVPERAQPGGSRADGRGGVGPA